MIKATEIRSGNIIADEDGTPMYVDYFTPSKFGYRYTDSAGNRGLLKECSGVTINEEWLLRLGFKDNGSTYSKPDNAVIGHDLSWFGLFFERHEEDITFDCPNYVHQLQNLYFALTGTELTINDKEER